MSYELLSVTLFLTSVFIYATKAGNNKFFFSVMLVIAGIFLLLNASLYASNYFTGDGINDAVIYTLTSTMTGAGINRYLLPAFGLTLLLLITFYLISRVLLIRKKRILHKGYTLLALLLALASVKTSPALQQIFALVRSQQQQNNSDFSQYYHQPDKIISGTKRNLVYIYAESLERTYFDNHAFPALTPELHAVKDNAIDFSQTEQLPGTEYTIAGMVASQCGIPLFAPFDGNASASLSRFYPETICLGDILQSSGYENYFMQGADLRFAGKDIFLTSHGFDSKNIYGRQELAKFIKDDSYHNNWGYYDDTLLDEVWKKFIQLSELNKPFSLFTLTVDTHHPDGFISRSCQRKEYRIENQKNQSFSAVACSQQHIARFIEKIKASPYFANTVIVVSSDHLAMNNTAWKYLNKQQRNNLFFIIRGDKPEQSEVIPSARSTLDNGATVLDILGGNNAIGLGRSTLSRHSLSSGSQDIREKIVQWKPDIIRLWHFPGTIKDYHIDQKKGLFTFSGSSFKLPLLLRVSEGKTEPLPEGEYAAPLRYQLSDFAASDKFVWADHCYKMARVWAKALALSDQYCLAIGQLSGQPEIIPVTGNIFKGSLHFQQQQQSDSQYKNNVAQLRIADNDIRYPSENYLFHLPGAPATVKHFTGLSRAEDWGRWSNANLAARVTIEYQAPLPDHFKLIITAKAIGENVDQPIPIRVGSQQQFLYAGRQIDTTTFFFHNSEKARTIEIIPPAPLLTNTGNITGQDPRRLGIGLVSMQVIPTAP